MHVTGIIRRPHQSKIVIGFVTGIVIGVMVISVVVIILIERVEIAYKKICGRSSLPEGIVRGVVFYNIIVSGFIIEIVIGFVVIVVIVIIILKWVGIARKKNCGRSSLPEGMVGGGCFWLIENAVVPPRLP